MASWDPDGPGPLAARVAVGGKFAFPDGTFSGVAYWSGTAWVRIPGVFGGDIDALFAMPDGRLLAGGFFSVISGQSNLPPLVSWDGTSWTGVGTKAELHIQRVNDIKQFPNGDLVAVGEAPAVVSSWRGIARWNGSVWSPLGTVGIPGSDEAHRMIFMPNGDLVVTGDFPTIDGITVNGIARWNGSVWSPLGTGFTSNGIANGLLIAPNGDLIVGGSFNTVGGVAAAKLARWNGTTWSAFSATPLTNNVSALAPLSGGQFIMRGGFTQRIASKWDGAAFSTIATKFAGTASTQTSVNTLVTLPDGRVIMGGTFEGFDALAAVNIASYEAGGWSAFGDGTDSAPIVIKTLSDGRVVAGGTFRSIAGVSANGIAIFDGSTWSPLGAGVQGRVRAIAELPDGRLVVGGTFTSAGGNAAASLAIWNGSDWAALGTAIAPDSSEINSLAYAPDNKLYIGGSFAAINGVSASRVASWNGTTFAPLGSGCVGTVYTLGWYSSKLIVGGEFDSAGGVANTRRIAGWNGATWSALGTGITGVQFGPQFVYTLLSASNGTLYVGGSFDQTNIAYGLGKWNGTSWSSEWSSSLTASIPSVATLIELPNGDIVAGGYISSAGTVPVNGITRRDHATGTWSSLSGGVNGITNTLGSVNAVARFGTGFFAGGTFIRAGGLPSARVAFYTDDASPHIGSAPSDVNADKGDTVILLATTSPGYPASGFQWERETAPLSGVYAAITNGPGGTHPAGGDVSGASGVLPSPTNTIPLVLSISNARPADSARYRVVLNGDCGSNASAPAQVLVIDTCPGDINSDGVVDDSDFTLFAAAYDILDCTDPSMPAGCPADMNADAFVDDADFVIFGQAYDELICP